MKNKDKYELSGADEDLSGRIDFNINVSNNKVQETVESDNYSKIKKRYEQESVHQKVKKMAEEANNVSAKNVVIPENINADDEKKADFTSKYKNDYKKEKEYKIYEEPIITAKYNNEKNKKEPIKIKGINAIGGVLFVFVVIMICGFAGVMELMADLENEFSYENIDTTFISDSKNPIDKIVNEENYELNKDTNIFKGIETRIIENEFGEKAVFVTNSNERELRGIRLSMVLYDENKKIVDINDEYFRVLPINHTVVAILNNNIPEFETYEIFYDVNAADTVLEYDKSTYLFNGVNFENIAKDSYFIKFDVNNTLPQEMKEMSYVILFYRDGEIVYFKDDFLYDLKERKSEKIYIDEELEYDNIEFLVNYISAEN